MYNKKASMYVRMTFYRHGKKIKNYQVTKKK